MHYFFRSTAIIWCFDFDNATFDRASSVIPMLRIQFGSQFMAPRICFGPRFSPLRNGENATLRAVLDHLVAQHLPVEIIEIIIQFAADAAATLNAIKHDDIGILRIVLRDAIKSNHGELECGAISLKPGAAKCVGESIGVREAFATGITAEEVTEGGMICGMQLMTCASNNNALYTARWLLEVARWDEHTLRFALQNAACAGDLTMVELLAPCLVTERSRIEAFTVCCHIADIAVIKTLVRLFGVEAYWISAFKNKALAVSAEIADWLVKAFSLITRCILSQTE